MNTHLYSSFSDRLAPLVQFEGNCLVSMVDLHNHRMQKVNQKNLMAPRAFKHYKWYNAILQEELYEATIGFRLQVFHWCIESGIREAFNIRGMQFNAVSMIIGPSMEYWYGINTGRDSFTKHGREPRHQPINPSDQFRYLLPRCPILMASCNCFDQYFERRGKRILDRTPSKQPDPSFSNSPISSRSVDQPVRSCNRVLFEIIEDDEAVKSESSEFTDDDHTTDEDVENDDNEDGGRQDILFFRISMCKFRRINQGNSVKYRLNIRGLKRKLTTIAEEPN